MAPDRAKARQRGQQAVEALRRHLTERAASLLKEHPEFAEGAAEVGLIDRAWLDDPDGRPIRTAGSLDVIERFLEKSVDREPSLIAQLGLNAIQLLSLDSEEGADRGAPHAVTLMFTDFEGFTRYTSRSGDEAARGLIESFHRVARPIIRGRGGRIVKKLGDGLLASFPAPEAAVLAALELSHENPTVLRLRIGLHHGEAVSMGDDLIGHDVNIAARVADSARGGEIVATTALRQAVGELADVEFGRARRRHFKGVDGSVLVCPVERPES